MRFLVVLTLLAGCGQSEEREVSEVTLEQPPTKQPPTKQPPTKQPPTKRPLVETPVPPTPNNEPRDVSAPPTGSVAMAPAVGQWARYQLRWRDGRSSTTEYRVVGQSDDAWILEVIDRREEATRVVRMTIKLDPEGRHELIELAFKTGDQINPVPRRTIPHFAPAVQSWLQMLWPPLPEGEPQSLTVGAGTFAGSVQGRRNVEFQGMETSSDVWYHPAVPITAMVRFSNTGDQRGHTLELLDYGEHGARSAFPAPE